VRFSLVDLDNEQKRFQDIELDSRIPVPRTGEYVLMAVDEPDRKFAVYEVMRVVHSYAVEVIFIHVKRFKE
jgi:hypothetical protein